MAQTYRFTANGRKMAVPARANLSAALDPKPIRERLTRRGDGLGTSGAVKITNPAYTGRNARTQSLGMGRVGQRGRVMDVPNSV